MIPETYVNRVLQYARQGFGSIEFPTYDTDWDSEAYVSVSGQNSNNSVRVTDAFLQAVRDDAPWELLRRTDGERLLTDLRHIGETLHQRVVTEGDGLASLTAWLRERIGASAGQDASWQGFHVVRDQLDALRQDVAAVRSHPLISDTVKVGGFIYDVDTGLIDQRL